MAEIVQKITPFLWFPEKAEEAARFYAGIFKNSRIEGVSDLRDVPGPEGEVKVVTFYLEGQRFMALNGGPGVFEFTGAVSFFVRCETQEEVDHFWARLSDGGRTSQCGWLTDKYGVYWQVVPAILGDLMGDPDEAKADRVTQAMLQMTKLDIAALQRAYDDTGPAA